MEYVLIASSTKKSYNLINHALNNCIGKHLSVWVSSGSEARRKINIEDYSLIIINSPLDDEFGIELAQFAVSQTIAGVIIIAKNEIFQDIFERVIDNGVLVIPKPLTKISLDLAVRHILAIRERFLSLSMENAKLRKRMEDMKIINRAKCILIECCGMTEPEAHSYIEKKAMDSRKLKLDVATELICIHKLD